MNTRKPLLVALLVLMGAVLACSAGRDNITIADLPQYVCPSATPHPTDTPLPTSPPVYPAFFAANLPSPYFSGMIFMRWVAQNAGTIYLRYSGQMSSFPYFWLGSNNQYLPIGFSGGGMGGSGGYTLIVPANVHTVTISLYATNGGFPQNFTAYRGVPSIIPAPYPCCMPNPIYPTPRPTYTPYPTPTPYIRTNDYFTGDMVYTARQPSGLQLGFRVTHIQSIEAATVDDDSNPQSLYTWTLTIRNVGRIPYTVFPPAQMYISVIRRASGGEITGVWGPSLEAADEAGLNFVDSTWDMQDIAPDETRTFQLAAYGPVGTPFRIAYVMNASTRPPVDGVQPTEVPGSNIVSWLNQANTECTGEIEPPR
ncbi:MAG: hypothetical protein HY862_07040 [Chloroflexi bacterium]|nr:hypothetical protein [Chloroflexota bacterium]